MNPRKEGFQLTTSSAPPLRDYRLVKESPGLKTKPKPSLARPRADCLAIKNPWLIRIVRLALPVIGIPGGCKDIPRLENPSRRLQPSIGRPAHERFRTFQSLRMKVAPPSVQPAGVQMSLKSLGRSTHFPAVIASSLSTACPFSSSKGERKRTRDRGCNTS
jgi:hypothetical protein